MRSIWIIDDSHGAGASELFNAIEERAHLGLFVHYQSSATLPTATPPDGAIVVVFAAEAARSALPLAAPAWLRTCDVIPQVNDANDVKNIRDYLRPLNAFVSNAHHPDYRCDVLADEVLTRALLARRERSCFVSYRREDGLAMARQLADRLAADGIQTFLDERSIAKGARFDEEIAYRLDDADVVVVLATPKLEQSKWAQREIAFANRSSIALLVVDCGHVENAHPLVLAAMPDQRFRPWHALPQSELDELHEHDLERLLGALYAMRVSGIARRIQSLVPAAEATLKRMYPRGAVVHGADLGELVESGSGTTLRVLPFRPTVESMWRARPAVPNLASVGFVYPENLARDARVRALRWALLPHRPQSEVYHVRQLF